MSCVIILRPLYNEIYYRKKYTTIISDPYNKFNFKKYYDTNKEFREKHKEYMKDKITCTCGLEITRNNKTNHLKSLKHKVKS